MQVAHTIWFGPIQLISDQIIRCTTTYSSHHCIDDCKVNHPFYTLTENIYFCSINDHLLWFQRTWRWPDIFFVPNVNEALRCFRLIWQIASGCDASMCMRASSLFTKASKVWTVKPLILIGLVWTGTRILFAKISSAESVCASFRNSNCMVPFCLSVAHWFYSALRRSNGPLKWT